MILPMYSEVNLDGIHRLKPVTCTGTKYPVHTRYSPNSGRYVSIASGRARTIEASAAEENGHQDLQVVARNPRMKFHKAAVDKGLLPLALGFLRTHIVIR